MKIKFTIDPDHQKTNKRRSLENINNAESNFAPLMKSTYGDDVPIYTLLNSTVIDMYIVPSMDREQKQGFNLSTVNFTWQSVAFENDAWDV